MFRLIFRSILHRHRDTMSDPELKRVLLTGASGYIGGRLLVELQRRGMAVRCLARRPEFLLPKVAPGTEVMAGDVLDRDSLAPAMRGIETAYYLVHSMAANDFEETDRLAARNFAEAPLQTAECMSLKFFVG
jgi:uncharacterized protein YbjT (DUF2867 family)